MCHAFSLTEFDAKWYIEKKKKKKRSIAQLRRDAERAAARLSAAQAVS